MKKLLLILALAFGCAVAHADSTTAIPAGKQVTLTVSAAGTTPFTYQWSKDGVAIAGATSAAYVIPSAATSHAGVYTVVVKNAYGTTASDKATINVGSAPQTVTITVTVAISP